MPANFRYDYEPFIGVKSVQRVASQPQSLRCSCSFQFQAYCNRDVILIAGSPKRRRRRRRRRSTARPCLPHFASHCFVLALPEICTLLLFADLWALFSLGSPLPGTRLAGTINPASHIITVPGHRLIVDKLSSCLGDVCCISIATKRRHKPCWQVPMRFSNSFLFSIVFLLLFFCCL